jgi:hypothetical protein
VLPSGGVTTAARFRAHARRKVRIRVALLWDSHARMGWQKDADVVDLGLGGACVELPPSQESPAPGERVTLAFATPALWDPLQLPSRVAWVAPASHDQRARVGLAFEPNDAAPLHALYETMATLSYEAT